MIYSRSAGGTVRQTELRKTLFSYVTLRYVHLFVPIHAVFIFSPVPFYLLCMGTTGVCGGEGAERAAGGGVLDLPSPSEAGAEPLRTEPSKSANFVAAEFRRKERRDMWRTGRPLFLHRGES